MVGRLIWKTHQRCKEKVLQDRGKNKPPVWTSRNYGDGHWTIPKQLLVDVHVHWKQTRRGASFNAMRQHVQTVWQQWKREYFHGLMESHHIRRRAWNYPEVEEVVLIVREEKNRGEWKKGLVLVLVLRGVVLWHKGHTIERPLNLVCSLGIKGPAVVGTAPMAQGLELRRNTWSAAQDARVGLQLLLQDKDWGLMLTSDHFCDAVVSTAKLLDWCADWVSCSFAS